MGLVIDQRLKSAGKRVPANGKAERLSVQNSGVK